MAYCSHSVKRATFSAAPHAQFDRVLRNIQNVGGGKFRGGESRNGFAQ